jgi:hypothetical protein
MANDDARSSQGEISFASLVVTLSSSAWVGLGKVADPISGEIRKDLAGARSTIEILLMLREKTKGNLAADEERLLNGLIADLQANYAETVFAEGEDASKPLTATDVDGTKSDSAGQ